MAMASAEEPAWRERERHLGAKDEGFIPVRTAGLYPLPSEGVRFVEPAWNLHGVIQDKECEDRFEQRMREAEEQKVSFAEDEELHRHDGDDARKEEMERRKIEAQELEAAMAAEEKAARAEAKRAFAEEIERAVRELRVEANEQHLRAAETQISTLHARAIRRDKALEEEEAKAEETYMASVQERREQELEEEEERRFDQILERLDLNDRVENMTKEAEKEEKEHIERQDRRSSAQQESHVLSDVTEEERLEQLARLSEQAAREEEEQGDADESHQDYKIVLQMLLDEAKAKHEEFKKELKERHLWFVDKLRQTAVNLHTEAERKRKEEWAAGDRTFKESNEILQRARLLVENMDTHVEQLNQEFKAIAERQDVWPMPKHRKPHSASAVEIKNRIDAAANEAQRAGGSAGEERRDLPRPRTCAERPEQPEPEPVQEVKVPTGFAHAIRIVFEHLDRKREGRLRETDVAEGLTLMGLDTGVSLAGLFSGVAGVDGIGYKEFQDMVLGAVGRAQTPARTPPEIGVPAIRTVA